MKTETYTYDLARDLKAMRQQRDELAAAARAVVWFDWSLNDDDAVKAIESLRAALAKL